MSIVIKGMEMPASRGEYMLRLYVYSDRTATVEGAYSRLKGEPFEAVPVPPHGRLIDANAVSLEGGPYEYDKWCEWALDQYLNAPTIIPAEEVE